MWVLAALTAGVLFIVRRCGGAKPGTARSAEGAAAAGRGRFAAPVLLLAALGVAIAQTAVVGALPVLGRRLGVSAQATTWLLTAFLLACGVAVPIACRLGKLFGYRPVMVVCLASLALGSALAAVADGSGWFAGLLAGRVLQGLSGGVFPLAFGLARRSVPVLRLPGLNTALSAMFGVGGAAGVLLAGPIVDLLGTAWLFWPTLLIALATLAGTAGLPRGPSVG